MASAKKKGVRKSLPVKKIAAGAAIFFAASGILYMATTKGNSVPMPPYEVLRVIDGDTFETKENQLIRLAGLDAPEREFCGAEEAKKLLEKKIVGKPVYAKVYRRDPYMRLNSEVYVRGELINKTMLESGWARLQLKEKLVTSNELKETAAQAKNEKRGIYSDKCSQTINEVRPNCTIKGNNPELTGAGKIYHLPGCKQYTITQMQMYLGDQWFCTEEEAQKAGYKKAHDCP